jgi:hypothetical protein
VCVRIVQFVCDLRPLGAEIARGRRAGWSAETTTIDLTFSHTTQPTNHTQLVQTHTHTRQKRATTPPHTRLISPLTSPACLPASLPLHHQPTALCRRLVSTPSHPRTTLSTAITRNPHTASLLLVSVCPSSQPTTKSAYVRTHDNSAVPLSE